MKGFESGGNSRFLRGPQLIGRDLDGGYQDWSRDVKAYNVARLGRRDFVLFSKGQMVFGDDSSQMLIVAMFEFHCCLDLRSLCLLHLFFFVPQH